MLLWHLNWHLDSSVSRPVRSTYSEACRERRQLTFIYTQRDRPAVTLTLLPFLTSFEKMPSSIMSKETVFEIADTVWRHRILYKCRNLFYTKPKSPLLCWSFPFIFRCCRIVPWSCLHNQGDKSCRLLCRLRDSLVVKDESPKDL